MDSNWKHFTDSVRTWKGVFPLSYRFNLLSPVSSINLATLNVLMGTVLIFLYLLQNFCCRGIKYYRLNTTRNGLSQIAVTCTDRYTRSPVADVILCEQETLCVALYKEWSPDGTKVHRTCTCVMGLGVTTGYVNQTRNLFTAVHKNNSNPGRIVEMQI